MLSKWIYLLIGRDNTGKTTFQKRLIYHLTGLEYKRLDRNVSFDIVHKYAPKKLMTLFIMSRSFQENKNEYRTVAHYFNNYFEEEDICILSSHTDISEIKEMISEGKKRKYNVGGVFFSNDNSKEIEEIAQLDWDERFYLENPWTENEEKWRKQIDNLAWEFAEMLIRRSTLQ